MARSAARKIRLFEPQAAFSLDFLAQSAVVHRRAGAARSGRSGVDLEELKGPPEDTLLAQLAAFVRAVRTREGDSATGIDALRTALRVVEAMLPLSGR